MNNILSEIIGTMILVFLGNGVVANVVLSKTKGNDKSRGWLMITLGWALAVFMSSLVSYPYSGAHLNPSVTISLALVGKFQWNLVPSYIISQFIGSILGAIMVWVLYRDHFLETDSQKCKLSVFSTIPAISNFFYNLLSECLTSFIFIFLILLLTDESVSIYHTNPDLVWYLKSFSSSIIIFGIGLSLGGPTGYAINPARDLGSRIVYSLISINDKVKSSNWNYAIIPILGAIFGSILASIFYLLLS
ncbi:MIP/aquaporin family protein [Blattabacterium cuenoti]|uniref:MIP/aquaporin family protein n=1 Tax=Blattabacterium cuenoti TaxID=1653831 RepID=UPI00163BBD7A|nr:MIP/aquaporin family protein [Blattabacterium cuenoti]